MSIQNHILKAGECYILGIRQYFELTDIKLTRFYCTYLNRLELWLRDWRLAINISKSTAMLFTKTTRHVQRPRPSQLFGEPIQWIETARYLGVNLDTRLTLSAHVNQVWKKAAQRLGLLSPLLNRSRVCP
jgi:hypothetical protein